jgi:hypothetical protein
MMHGCQQALDWTHGITQATSGQSSQLRVEAKARSNAQPGSGGQPRDRAAVSASTILTRTMMQVGYAHAAL